jgi:hypothetical protein
MHDSSQAQVLEIASLPTGHKVRSRTSMPVLLGLVFVTRAAPVAYFVLVCGGPIGHGRYRMPIMPLVCLSAGAALARRTSRSKISES